MLLIAVESGWSSDKLQPQLPYLYYNKKIRGCQYMNIEKLENNKNTKNDKNNWGGARAGAGRKNSTRA